MDPGKKQVLLTRKEFAYLHNALYQVYLEKNKGRRPRNIKMIYGIGNYADKDTSIAGIVYNALKKLDSSVYAIDEIFPERSQDRRGFQGRALSNARICYEKGYGKHDHLPKRIPLSEKYLNAYLKYFQVNNRNELIDKYPTDIDPDNLPDKLIKKPDPRGKPLTPIPSGKSNASDMDTRIINIAKKKLDGTSWYLYSLNERDKKIIRAVVEIVHIGPDGKAQVNLKNPPGRGYKSYIGIMSVRHIHKNYLLFGLNTELDTKFIRLTMQYDLEWSEPIEIMLGVMVKTNEAKELMYTDVFMELIKDTDAAKPRALTRNGEDIDKHVVAFFDSPDFVMKKVERFVFTINDLV